MMQFTSFLYNTTILRSYSFIIIIYNQNAHILKSDFSRYVIKAQPVFASTQIIESNEAIILNSLCVDLQNESHSQNVFFSSGSEHTKNAI